jgi:3-hydroxyisobutyrate dehydrogenase-like beta-hydroxyacid dehydrogenase
MRIGFVGLGVMGQPMAVNLARAGLRPLVWNRTASRVDPVVAASGRRAGDLDEVFRDCEVVLLMLADEAASWMARAADRRHDDRRLAWRGYSAIPPAYLLT